MLEWMQSTALFAVSIPGIRGAKHVAFESSEFREVVGKSVNAGSLSCFSVCLVYARQQFCLFFFLQREDSTYLIGVTKGCFRGVFKLLETRTTCFHKASKT